MMPAGDPVEAVFREDRGRLLATLAARFGDLDLAEDVASETIITALERWPAEGVPDKPLAWLTTTARRKAIDRIRRDQGLARRLALLHLDAELTQSAPSLGAQEEIIPDDRLQMFFTCCHPALRLEAQTALTLRFLAGMSTPQVAKAFLVPVPTMAQRLVRAKRKIRDARIPFRVPDSGQMARRLPGVLHVIYLLFTEGYAASEGQYLVRGDLSDEAIRLARLLRRLMPDQPEVEGLLALMLLTDARRPARVDERGEAVSLEDQDRALWNRELIGEGQAIVMHILKNHPANAWVVQAAIAAVHDEAATIDATDWDQLVSLYDVLYSLTPTPLVSLNRAIAVAWRDGPAAGLELIEPLRNAPELRGYHPLHAARAELFRRLGRPAEAAHEYRAALEAACNQADKAYLRSKLRAAQAAAAGTVSPPWR